LNTIFRYLFPIFIFLSEHTSCICIAKIKRGLQSFQELWIFNVELNLLRNIVNMCVNIWSLYWLHLLFRFTCNSYWERISYTMFSRISSVYFLDWCLRHMVSWLGLTMFRFWREWGGVCACALAIVLAVLPTESFVWRAPSHCHVTHVGLCIFLLAFPTPQFPHWRQTISAGCCCSSVIVACVSYCV